MKALECNTSTILMWKNVNEMKWRNKENGWNE
jgi:hypothetical protein